MASSSRSTQGFAAGRGNHRPHEQSPPDSGKAVQQKNERALERKRAADRNARRLERSRTKEHIAQLEERIHLLARSDDSSNSSFIEKLLAENAALNERIFEYQKQINSARLILDGAQSTPATSAPVIQADFVTAQDQPQSTNKYENSAEMLGTPRTDHSHLTPLRQQEPTMSASPPHAPSSDRPEEYVNTITSSTVPPGFLGNFFNSSYLPGPRSVYLLHHPSPLANTSIYKTAAGLPEFHDNRSHLGLDISSGHSLTDVIANEKLSMFYGAILPIFSPSLLSLYQGVTDNLSGLDPYKVLNDLLPNGSRSAVQTPGQDLGLPTAINLLKMSIAKYVAGVIREAQNNLTLERRRSDVEIVAVFWVMTRLLTWMAFPTSKNYSDIPAWYRPTQAQLSVPHPSYIDSLIFPLLRDKLVYTYENYKNTKLLENLNSLFTIKWEPKVWLMCQSDGALISLSPENPWEFQLEPEYEAAICDLRSWRMSPEFTTRYPELASCVHT